jgi:DNA-binding beta-propeller fold protein YncE
LRDEAERAASGCDGTFGTAGFSLIDTQTNRTLHTLKLKGRPPGVSFSPDGQRGYVTDYGEDSLMQDPSSLISIGAGGRYPINPGPGKLTIFSARDGATLQEIVVGHWPSSVIAQTVITPTP